jgi:hypothetical protein
MSPFVYNVSFYVSDFVSKLSPFVSCLSLNCLRLSLNCLRLSPICLHLSPFVSFCLHLSPFVSKGHFIDGLSPFVSNGSFFKLTHLNGYFHHYQRYAAINIRFYPDSGMLVR